jgi:hypothetical protein
MVYPVVRPRRTVNRCDSIKSTTVADAVSRRALAVQPMFSHKEPWLLAVLPGALPRDRAARGGETMRGRSRQTRVFVIELHWVGKRCRRVNLSYAAPETKGPAIQCGASCSQSGGKRQQLASRVASGSISRPALLLCDIAWSAGGADSLAPRLKLSRSMNRLVKAGNPTCQPENGFPLRSPGAASSRRRIPVLVHAPDRTAILEDGVVKLIAVDRGREAGVAKCERHR